MYPAFGLMLFHMDNPKPPRAGFVLAGGKSSRMGANVDKVFLEFRGRTLLDRALDTARSVCAVVSIVGDPAKFAHYLTAEHAESKDADSQAPTAVPDIFPNCGPLGGIHAALAQSSAEQNLMLAVDMPLVSKELLEFLFKTAEANESIVTVPRVGKGLQPLCAIYRRQFAAAAEIALREGKYKIDAVFGGVSIRVIEAGELSDAGFTEEIFFNVNTPHDRLMAEQVCKVPKR